MFTLKNLNSEAKRSKLMLNCESSEAKRTCSTVEKIISKRSKHVYIEEFEYRSEANRFDSDFVFKKTKKSELSFFLKTKGKKRKGSLVNYRSFAIPTPVRHKHMVFPPACISPLISEDLPELRASFPLMHGQNWFLVTFHPLSKAK
jgi:hypothetical protein